MTSIKERVSAMIEDIVSDAVDEAIEGLAGDARKISDAAFKERPAPLMLGINGLNTKLREGIPPLAPIVMDSETLEVLHYSDEVADLSKLVLDFTSDDYSADLCRKAIQALHEAAEKLQSALNQAAKLRAG